MYENYKTDFVREQGKNERPQLKCIASELWIRGEMETLKKFVLAEAFKQVQPDVQDISKLNTESSLYIAMQNSFRGGDDYPKDSNLVLTENQK